MSQMLNATIGIDIGKNSFHVVGESMSALCTTGIISAP